MKTGAKPGGTPGAPAGQPGAEGESVFSKILPGGAAEQAGKLTEAVSAFGKKIFLILVTMSCWASLKT